MGNTVLLVEDDPLSAEFMRLFLEAANYNVKSVGSQTLALAAIAAECPIALVTDMQLPDGSGIEISQIARKSGCSKIIGVTGYERAQLAEKGLDLSSFDVFLTKPVDLNELAHELAVK